MNTETKQNIKNKNGIILAICVVVLVIIIAACFIFLKGKDSGAAIEYLDPNGNVTASVDMSFMSLMTAVMNYQLGTDALDDEGWETAVDGDGKTIKDYVIDTSVDYAGMLLKSEYISDYIYGFGFSDEQEKDIDDFMAELVAAYGTEDALENYLSGFGTNSASLRRFMELSMKQKTLLGMLYASITDEEKMQYFEENYMVADHIMIKLQGALKDDGTVIPLTDEQKKEKIEYAKNVFNEIKGGVRDFDTAIYEIGEDTYKLAYPNGYFIPNSGNSNLDSKVINEIRVMKDGEMRLVETENAVFIVRRNPMNRALCLASGDFSAIIGSELAQNEFWMQCQALDGTVVHEEIIDELDPSAIMGFNIDGLGQ